jgi:hypothetical protein
MKRGKNKSVDQVTIAKLIATRLGMNATQVYEIIELEQKTTMSFVKKGYKVVKKNYLTLSPVNRSGYMLASKLNGKLYLVPDRTTVRVRVGIGFRSYLAHQKALLPNKLCRFVASKYEPSQHDDEDMNAVEFLNKGKDLLIQ